jgi:NMD protein affecting ribosome stability and mRNA decay
VNIKHLDTLVGIETPEYKELYKFILDASIVNFKIDDCVAIKKFLIQVRETERVISDMEPRQSKIFHVFHRLHGNSVYVYRENINSCIDKKADNRYSSLDEKCRMLLHKYDNDTPWEVN